MEKVEIKIFTKSILISIPIEFRNKIWAESFGKVQMELRNIDREINEILIDATKCEWADPLPLLSLIIALSELNNRIQRIVLLPDLSEVKINQRKFLAFIEKDGFIDTLLDNNIKIQIIQSNGIRQKSINKQYRQSLRDYEKYLFFHDSTILEARVIDLSTEIKDAGIERFIDDELSAVRHRFKKKLKGVHEKQVFNRVGLFLKETTENVLEHAYINSQKKLIGFYIRFRIGLGDNSLDQRSYKILSDVAKKEHNNSPRLNKSFVDNNTGFFEIFIIDAGQGITNNYFGKHNPKRKFREAWRQTIGLGQRGQNSSTKKTEFGGLYSLSRLCLGNYLVARDYSEWVGDELPIKGTNPEKAPNRSYRQINTNTQVEGLGLIGRFSWKSASDENDAWKKIKDIKPLLDNILQKSPYIEALEENNDIYIKYYQKHFSDIDSNPFHIIDNRFNIIDKRLEKDYFNQKNNIDFCIYIPEQRLIKNKILDIICNSFLDFNTSSKSIIIADIAVWEANIYQLALERAQYPKEFLKRFDRIILITRRLSVLILVNNGSTYISDINEAIGFIKNDPEKFAPDSSLKHFIEWLRTHDSMIFWQYIKQSNEHNEYFLNEKIAWYQEEKDVGLYGYLNFAKTLTDSFCKKIYEYSLERTLCLANQFGCLYKSIDVLTKKLTTQSNSLFYNKIYDNSQIILLGSVFVSGYSERSSEIEHKLKHSNFKIHFFHNQNTSQEKIKSPIAHLLLWPLKGNNWYKENLGNENKIMGTGNYRRVGTSHVIAPFGWKYFPIPRYKLFNKKTNTYLNEFTNEQINNKDFEFRSIYKSSPKETYYDWQGKRNQILSIDHVCYESNHDIFRIDFPYVVNESFMVGGNLSQFLIGEFLHALGSNESDITDIENIRLVNGVKKYLQIEYPQNNKNIGESAVIVYPYHFNTEHVVSIIKSKIDKKLHHRIIALFPLNKERTNTTFLTSPLTIETLKKKIKDFKTNSPQKSINVLLFDDAIIAGKTRKEIKHLLFSLGVNNITTVSIIERRRLPFNTSDPRFNKAYWRLDIPKLGNSVSCPICNVLNQLSNIKGHVTSNNMLKRISEIEDIWKEKHPFEGTENRILTPTNIELNSGKIFKKFGIYFNGSNFEQCGGDKNRIEIVNSLGLTIYLSELHSMTSRDDVIFKYSDNPEINEYAKIEMLSTYLLLFGKELSNITQERIIKQLFSICNEIDSNNHTSFAVISLLAQGSSKLECLYDICKDSGESDIKISNFDLQILLAYLSLNTNSIFSRSNILKRLHEGYKNLRDLYKQFHSEIYNDYGIAHDTPLQLIIKEEYSMKVIRESEDACDKLLSVINKIPNWYLRFNGDNRLDHTIAIKNLSNLMVKFKEISTEIEHLSDSTTLQNLRNVTKQIFKVLNPIHEKLFVCIGLKVDDFPLKSCINKLINESDEKIGLSKSFTKLNISQDTLLERWITWDRDTERKMTFLLGNTKHALSEIADPFDTNCEVLKKAWVTIKYNEPENNLSILIYNMSNIKSTDVKHRTSLKIKPEKLHLKELEIFIDYEDVIINDIPLLKTIITFPYL